MASTFIYITIQGDGSVSWVSSSIGGSLIRSIDTNGSGEFASGYDYKFLTNKVLLGLVTSSTGGSVFYSPTDESFTIRSGVQTASVNVIFTPKKEPKNIFAQKPNTNSGSPLSIASFNFLPYISPIGEEPVQAGVTLPTQVDYNAGYMYRYFYKQTNNPDALVRELNKTQFDSLAGAYFYTTLEIKWKITGNDIKVKEINGDILEIAERTLPGIKAILQRNLLQYWQTGSYSPNTQFNATARVKAQNMAKS